ncbi:hypothetical protein N7U66_10705 [Lacinutrix neustonica]|uniref:Tetratricopeptide repeat protein n=1 Tax=Lacinutrix neustonica TaxID=2980107 RepID=A0A9E8MZP7_9FLAO|nr:hypothetical protein [Lacinutrix neustonica]WAC03834.1 hypothetical protein N7U66_10705 [Lacinutrix neustonica]
MAFSLSEAQDLEQQIIMATDVFVEHSNPETLQTLNQQIERFEPQLSSKNEYYEFIYLLVNKGYYLKQNNQITHAIQAYEKAYALYKKHRVLEFDIVEYCLIDLGILYHRTNNYTNAENSIKQYLFIAEKNNNVSQQIKGAKNLANLYQKLGKHKSAIAIVDKALHIKNLTSSKQLELHLLKTQSEIALNTQNTLADHAILTQNEASGFTKHQAVYLLSKQKGDYTVALAHFNELKHYQNSRSQSIVDLAKFKFEEAQLYYLLGDKSTCAEHLQTALKILIPKIKVQNGLPHKDLLFAENTFIDIFDLLAELQTNPENALACYDLSFYVSELLDKNITDQQGKLINLTQNRNRSERCISALYELSGSSDSIIHIARAFGFSERHKAAILKGVINKKSLLENHPKDGLLLRQQDLFNTQDALRFKLIKMPYSPETASKINSLRDSINTIAVALKTLNTAIEKRYPTVIKTASFKSIREKLKEDNATLVEYFFGKTNIYQFVISESTAKLIKIALTDKNRKSIANFINYFNTASAINNDVPQYTKDAFELYKILQLNQVKDKKNLIIIPRRLLKFYSF